MNVDVWIDVGPTLVGWDTGAHALPIVVRVWSVLPLLDSAVGLVFLAHMPATTGSVGIGATATIWSAVAHRYIAGHFDVPRGGRHVALLGDAELDEGAIWETLVDPVVSMLVEVLWLSI